MVVGLKCHVLVRTVVIFRFVIFNSSYTTGFSFILVPTWLLISVSVYNTFDSYRRACQFTNILAATVSVVNMHSALMHAKLLFPDKCSRFNERRTDCNMYGVYLFHILFT